MIKFGTNWNRPIDVNDEIVRITQISEWTELINGSHVSIFLFACVRIKEQTNQSAIKNR